MVLFRSTEIINKHKFLIFIILFIRGRLLFWKNLFRGMQKAKLREFFSLAINTIMSVFIFNK